MKLRQIIAGLGKVETVGSLDREITGIAYDSRCVTPGKLFVAMRGTMTDGHNYIASVAERGALAVVCEKKGTSGGKITRIIVPDTRKVLPVIASTFYGNPASKLNMIGVTGTNGKTTVTFLIKQIFERAGIRMGLLGTIRYEIGDRVIPAQRTTPESLDLHTMLSKMLVAGGQCCVMEVSSHSLEQGRVAGICFDTAVFTNLTRDHLDYHVTMENYFASKKRLFTEGAKEGKLFHAVINVDDSFGAELAQSLPNKEQVISYGLKTANATVSASNIQLLTNRTQMRVKIPSGEFDVQTPLIGRYNVLNTLSAIGVGVANGIAPEVMVEALSQVPPVPGRLEHVDAGQPFSVLVDYAHTDDAMINVLGTLKEIALGKVLLMFGCGGSRDKGKRAKMGEAAAQYADYTIITTDNPRREEPAAIAAEVERGYRSVREDAYEVELDRALAIERIIGLAQPGDTVLLCGKGHETYQEFNGIVVPFDDRVHALSALANYGYKGGRG